MILFFFFNITEIKNIFLYCDKVTQLKRSHCTLIIFFASLQRLLINALFALCKIFVMNICKHIQNILFYNFKCEKYNRLQACAL